MNTKFIFSLLIAHLSLCSCVTPQGTGIIEYGKRGESKEIAGPDGTPHRLVSCANPEVCYKRSAEDCGGKFHIVDHTDSTANGFLTTRLLIKCDPK